jgi:hypothetical protein
MIAGARAVLISFETRHVAGLESHRKFRLTMVTLFYRVLYVNGI